MHSLSHQCLWAISWTLLFPTFASGQHLLFIKIYVFIGFTTFYYRGERTFFTLFDGQNSRSFFPDICVKRGEIDLYETGETLR